MCAEGVDAVEHSGSGMLRSASGRTQESYPSGLGSREEEISAMLHNGHANITQQAALMGVMNPPASSNNSDLLNSFRMPYSTYQGGYNNVPADFSSRQPTIRAPSGGGAATILPPQHRWGTNYNGVQQDEKSSWGHVEPVKSETLEIPMSPNQAQTFDASGAYETPATSFTGMLQRYHSAPSTFLQSLSEIHEDHGAAGGGNGFSQVSNNAMGSLFPPDRRLTPITEQMDVDRMPGTGLSMHDFEHFLGGGDQGEFGQPRSTSLSSLGKKELENTFLASKETSVLRQKRPPAVSLDLINKATKDRLDTNASAEESSSATSEENSLDVGLKAMYAQDEYFRDSLTSWKSPTSPAGGKRLRGLAGDSDTSSGSAEAPHFPYRNGQFGSLRRHLSLPSPTDALTSLSADDQAAFGTVQMRARAKRGCATHPRSIAERVRRTRISERMKKLQDLVPNMDKQTNTADMLDETVEYVKSLQLQVEELNETVAKLRAAQQAMSVV